MNNYLLATRNAAFWRGAAVALALSSGGALVFAIIVPLVGAGLGARVVLILLSLCYLLYLLQLHVVAKTKSSGLRVRGVWVGLALWGLLVATLCLLNPGIWWWLVTLVTMVWLIRCLRCYRSLLAAATDAVANGIALLLTLATALHTQSVFLSLWCFFLSQAALVYLPGSLVRAAKPDSEDPQQPFAAACRSAEDALRRISTSQ